MYFSHSHNKCYLFFSWEEGWMWLRDPLNVHINKQAFIISAFNLVRAWTIFAFCFFPYWPSMPWLLLFYQCILLKVCFFAWQFVFLNGIILGWRFLYWLATCLSTGLVLNLVAKSIKKLFILLLDRSIFSEVQWEAYCRHTISSCIVSIDSTAGFVCFCVSWVI